MTITSKNYSAIDIANYVISKSTNPTGADKVTNLKLQKILYFLQAAFLVERQESLIAESFQPWAYGPVVPEAYRFFNQFGYKPIERPVSEFTINTSDNGFNVVENPFDEQPINAEDRELIDKYYQSISRYSAGQLIDLTHEQDFWQRAEKSGEIARKNSRPYSNDDILNSFQEDKFRIWEAD